MNSQSQYIYSEEPREDQWRSLLQFSYRKNVESRLAAKGFAVDDHLVDIILGSFQQAHEYFKLGSRASLFTSPTLVYYGAAHLLYAASTLLTGQTPNVGNHGLRLVKTEASRSLADAAVEPCNWNSGSFPIMAKAFSNVPSTLTSSGSWSLHDFIGSLPDLEEDYTRTYPDRHPHVLPVEEVKTESGMLDRIELEKLQVWKGTFDWRAIVGASSSFLQPQRTNQYLVFRRRLGYKGLGEHALPGRKFFRLYHSKGKHQYSLHQISLFQGALFILGHLARYSPQTWYPFAQNDSTGERHLVEKFVSVSTRRFPNLILNELQEQNIVFTSHVPGRS